MNACPRCNKPNTDPNPLQYIPCYCSNIGHFFEGYQFWFDDGHIAGTVVEVFLDQGVSFVWLIDGNDPIRIGYPLPPTTTEDELEKMLLLI
jgi:hypothetical protein